jgi:hypothetical protein
MSSYKMISFSEKKLEEFKKVFKKAEKNSEEFFTFEGDEYLITYSKYMIEHLELKFKKEHEKPKRNQEKEKGK